MSEPAVTMTETAVDLITEPAGVPRARAMLQRAQWAARAFSRYDKAAVDRIVHAAAQAGAAKAREYAELGRERDRVRRGRAQGDQERRLQHRAGRGVRGPRLRHAQVRPCREDRRDATAGRGGARPHPFDQPGRRPCSSSPCLPHDPQCRRVSPHPMAKACCADAATHLGRRRGRGRCAGGGHPGRGRALGPAHQRAHDRRAHRRDRRHRRDRGGAGRLQLGHPGDRCRPRQRAGARRRQRRPGEGGQADRRHQELRQLDPVHQRVRADLRASRRPTTLLRHLKRRGRAPAGRRAGRAIRETLFPGGRSTCASSARTPRASRARPASGCPGNTRVLLAPFDLVVPEEPLAHEKLCPVLGLVGVPTARRGIDAARAVLRIAGPGHSAAIHSGDARDDHGLRRGGRGAAGLGQRRQQPGQLGHRDEPRADDDRGHRLLRPVSVAENLQPEHFMQWTRMAYNSDPAEPFGNFSGLIPWESPAGPVPPYPYASNMAEAERRAAPSGPAHAPMASEEAGRAGRADRTAGWPTATWRRYGRRSGGWWSRN